MFPKCGESRGHHSSFTCSFLNLDLCMNRKEIFSLSDSILCDLSFPLPFQSLYMNLLVHFHRHNTFVCYNTTWNLKICNNMENICDIFLSEKNAFSKTKCFKKSVFKFYIKEICMWCVCV